MAKRSAFVLPKGLELELTDDTISIRYDGDVRLEGTLGRTIGEIHADGDVDLSALDKVTGTVSCSGKLKLENEVDAEVLHGREIILGKQSIKATAISATERIVIGPARLAVDCIIAPEIVLDPKASGRVTVIESLNERGATKIKGGFTLADYADMFGNAAEFLAERGLEPLSDAAPRPQRSSEEAGEDEDEDNDGAPAEAEPPAAAPEPQPEVHEEEDVDDPLSLSIDDIEEILDEQSQPGGEVDAQLQAALNDAMDRIANCYEGSDLPPAVSELQLLIEQGDPDALRDNITEVWAGLLSYHQKRGIRPHHQVTHAFNMIHGLLQG